VIHHHLWPNLDIITFRGSASLLLFFGFDFFGLRLLAINDDHLIVWMILELSVYVFEVLMDSYLREQAMM